MSYLRFFVRASRRYTVLASLARLRFELYARQAKRARLADDDAMKEEEEEDDEEEEKEEEEEEMLEQEQAGVLNRALAVAAHFGVPVGLVPYGILMRGALQATGKITSHSNGPGLIVYSNKRHHTHVIATRISSTCLLFHFFLAASLTLPAAPPVRS